MKKCKIQLNVSTLQNSIELEVKSMYNKKEIIEHQLQDTIEIEETKTCFILSTINNGFDYALDFGLN